MRPSLTWCRSRAGACSKSAFKWNTKSLLVSGGALASNSLAADQTRLHSARHRSTPVTTSCWPWFVSYLGHTPSATCHHCIHHCMHHCTRQPHNNSLITCNGGGWHNVTIWRKDNSYFTRPPIYCVGGPFELSESVETRKPTRDDSCERLLGEHKDQWPRPNR